MSKLEVGTLVPASFVTPAIKSPSTHIVRKRKYEVLPVSNTSYSYGGNDRIQIQIRSSTDFLNAMESYLRFELRTYGRHDGTNNAVIRGLATGGAHALFRAMEIRLPNGTLLERIESSDKLYAVVSSAQHSPKHIQHAEWASGDSLGIEPAYDGAVSVPKEMYSRQLTGTAVEAQSGGSGDYDTLTGTSTLFAEEVAVGDQLLLRTAPAATLVAQHAIVTVKTVSSATSIVFSPPVSEAMTGGATLEMFALPLAARCLACKPSVDDSTLATAGYDITMRPMLSFLNMREFIPLFLMSGGFTLELELNDPYRALQISDRYTASASAVLNYSLENVRYIASMVQPSQDIIQQYVSMYNGQGINYAMLQYRHVQSVEPGASGTYSVAQNVNVRSLRFVLAIVQNLKSNSGSGQVTAVRETAIQNYDSVGTFVDGKVSSYQFTAGSDQFPQIKVDCSDDFLTEAFAELQKTSGNIGNTLYEPRFQMDEWFKGNPNSDTEVRDESHKLIMSTRFDRGDGVLTGYDSSISAINMNLEFSAVHQVGGATSSRYIDCWYAHDVILSLSRNGGFVVRR